MLRVLIAEDDLMIADALTTNGYEVYGVASSVEGAVALGRLHRPDLAVIDMRLANGTEIVTQLADPVR
jgi:ActR/RegA family two-component response regulator